MIGKWFEWLDDISWDYPGLSIMLALLTGIAAGTAIWYLFCAILWGLYFLFW